MKTITLNDGAFDISSKFESGQTTISYSTPRKDYNIYVINGNWEITTTNYNMVELKEITTDYAIR
jgi:hypothetical protein